MILIDQHAAHEKVKYEMLMKRFHDKQPVSQNLMPPLIVTLTGAEAALLNSIRSISNSSALKSIPSAAAPMRCARSSLRSVLTPRRQSFYRIFWMSWESVRLRMHRP